MNESHRVAQTPSSLGAVSSEIYKCNRCGFCQTRCPVYRVTGLESSVARGHLSRLRATLEGELPFDNSIRDSLFACLMCRACTAECPPAIQTDRIITAARSNYVKQAQSRLQRFIFRRLLANPAALRAAVRVLSWLKRSRLTIFANLLRLLPWFERGLAEAPALMPIPGSFLRERIARRDACIERHEPLVAYFVGCAVDYAFPEIGEASLKLLETAGYGVAMLPNVCCGLPPYAYGDLESARALARKNMDALRGMRVEAILTDCASCSSFLKDYPLLFEEDDPLRAEAESLAEQVQDLSSFLSRIEFPNALRSINAIITYHDPCHLSRYHKLVKEPRELLRRIPGVDYRELPEADWCCGGAGSYALFHHELSLAILKRKMENLRATGAEVLVTACPACIMQLRYGAKKFQVPIKVMHLTELLSLAVESPTNYPKA